MRRAAYEARQRAVDRMRQECLGLGGDGVVAIQLTVTSFPAGGVEFRAVGTAVRAAGDVRPPEPFMSDLTGQDFWTLLQTGYVPLGMVMGTCVYHVAHRTVGNVLSNVGRNTELPQYTQALYNARELAMERMQKEAEVLHAEGIVGVRLSQLNHTWGCHTTEFFAIGTAVRPIGNDHTIPDPYLVLGLDT